MGLEWKSCCWFRNFTLYDTKVNNIPLLLGVNMIRQPMIT